jgi:ABC-type nitrate/sulfonate/bicarbonate transport system permease component
MREWADSGELWRDATISQRRALIGLAVGATLGLIIGLNTGRIPVLDATLSPVLHLLRPLPPVAAIPLIIVLAGIDEKAKIIAIAFGVFWPVWVSSHVGARDIPKTYLWSAKALGAGRLRTLRSIVLPASMPYVVVGLRQGIAVAYVMVFVAELAGASSGLGYAISVSHLAYRVDRMMAGMVVLCLFGAATDWLFVATLGVLLPWLKLNGQR